MSEDPGPSNEDQEIVEEVDFVNSPSKLTIGTQTSVSRKNAYTQYKDQTVKNAATQTNPLMIDAQTQVDFDENINDCSLAGMNGLLEVRHDNRKTFSFPSALISP